MRRKEARDLKLFSVRLDVKLIDALKLKAVKEHTTVQALMARGAEWVLKHPCGEDRR
jgi:hypothetical protein